IITNYNDENELVKSENNPEADKITTREIPFARELYIEREDFMENPQKKFFRLSPGQKVRLKSAYIIQCDEVIKDATGKITELRCSYLPESKSGGAQSNIKVQATIH